MQSDPNQPQNPYPQGPSGPVNWQQPNGVPPQQVPERVGYSANPQYFVHLFSKATGMTPREYAQALRIEP